MHVLGPRGRLAWIPVLGLEHKVPEAHAEGAIRQLEQPRVELRLPPVDGQHKLVQALKGHRLAVLHLSERLRDRRTHDSHRTVAEDALLERLFDREPLSGVDSEHAPRLHPIAEQGTV